jgi:predicted PhzF superfamily epimerase YddE/YHI9
MAAKPHTVAWAWIDEAKGLVRARTFAQDWGIPEDEANGSGSMQLAVNLRRKLTLRHGKGSIIHAQPSREVGHAEVGGLVIVVSD